MVDPDLLADDDTRGAVLAEMSPAQVVEAVARLANRCSNKVLTSLGSDLDEIRPQVD